MAESLEQLELVELEEELDESEDLTEQEQVPLLSILRAATPSDLARKRQLKRNPPPVGQKKRKSSKTTHNPKSVSPYQRVKEFPNENLTVSGGKLFCNGCREELGLKATVVRLHVKSKKHKLGKEKLQGRNKEEIDIAQAFDAYNQKEHLAGETLSNDLQVYRIKVVRTFLKAGVPLNKVDLFRDILEEHGLRLAERRVLSDLVPFIRKKEVIKISQEIEEREVSVIFDGTTRIGEALVIILRFIGDDWEVTHRLIRMQLLAKSLTGEEIARELISVLQADYHVGAKALVGSMHDRASVNIVAMSTIKVLYPEVFDVGCFSHTIDHVGEKFKTPTLDEPGLRYSP